ncbi:MAG: GGDEF domain-containing protein [Noviherbaspirillum sp.]
MAPAKPAPGAHGSDAERAALTVALYSLLQDLPQSYSGRENIKLLCHAILGATSRLRFVWVGFCRERAERVKPYAAAGACAQESADWSLPRSAFDAAGAYSQVRPGLGSGEQAMQGVFFPWRGKPSACSASCALAIPLRSDTPGLRGMIVFYADSPEYFQGLGVPVFQAFCHVAEIIWKQSSLAHLAAQQVQQDQLTGLMSRRQTMLALEKEIAAAEQGGHALSILMCRIEGIGKLNALYGCVASDAILAAFARELAERMRPQSLGGRWAGVTFLYVLPGIDAAEAGAVAAQLRADFVARPVSVDNWSVRLEVAVGVAAYSSEIMGLDDLVLHAAQGLSARTPEPAMSL